MRKTEEMLDDEDLDFLKMLKKKSSNLNKINKNNKNKKEFIRNKKLYKNE